MPAFKRDLSNVQDLLTKGKFDEARTECSKALKEGRGSNYDAYVYAGKAAYYTGDYKRAQEEYRAAIDLDGDLLGAWEGLAECQLAAREGDAAVETFEHLLDLAEKMGSELKQREHLWRGAEAYRRTGDLRTAQERLKSLLAMELTEEQRLEALCFLADIQLKDESSRQEQLVAAEMAAQGKTQAGGKMLRSRSSVRLSVDASRADTLETEEGGLGLTLKLIAESTTPSPSYCRYHEAHLQRLLSRLGAYPPRSVTRNERRNEALAECVRQVTTGQGGCCTPFPFTAAIWLLEEQEELRGGIQPSSRASRSNLLMTSGPNASQQQLQMHTQLKWYRGDSIAQINPEAIRKMLSGTGKEADDKPPAPRVVSMEAFGKKLAHQFPWDPAAMVSIGLAMRRRFLSDPLAPSTRSRRQQIMRSLQLAVERGADSAAGWKALADLQYQNRQWQAAHDTAVHGLEWSVARRRAGHETLTSFALALRLCVARCLRRLNRLDDALHHFETLAGWTSEGDVSFGGLSGAPPLSVRNQAMRGIAKVAMARGDRDGARKQYERILGKSLIGRGAPAEHWAHSEYAWLLFENGELASAKDHLEKALQVTATKGCAVTDSEIAEHHYKLGRVMWIMGGNLRSSPKYARRHFEAASMEENDWQAEACAWLGHWWWEVRQDSDRAMNCFSRALELNPDDTVTSEALNRLRKAANISEEDRGKGTLPMDMRALGSLQQAQATLCDMDRQLS